MSTHPRSYRPACRERRSRTSGGRHRLEALRPHPCLCIHARRRERKGGRQWRVLLLYLFCGRGADNDVRHAIAAVVRPLGGTAVLTAAVQVRSRRITQKTAIEEENVRGDRTGGYRMTLPKPLCNAFCPRHVRILELGKKHENTAVVAIKSKYWWPYCFQKKRKRISVRPSGLLDIHHFWLAENP